MSHVEFLAVCPEVEIGLGVPRKSLRLVRKEGETGLLQNETGLDLTVPMKSFVKRFLEPLEIDGAILKEKSPSCGMRDVKIYPSAGKVQALPEKGAGLFGGAVREAFPNLPLENEGRLLNRYIREHFLTGVFARARCRALAGGGTGDLVAFHSDNKLLLMMYNQTIMREMGRLVAKPKEPFAVMCAEYRAMLDAALARPPRVPAAINVLMHALGYFSKGLSAGEKAHFLDLLGEFRSGILPLSACNALLNSWIVRFDERYLKRQTFFRPFPEGLADCSDSSGGRGGGCRSHPDE